MDPTQTPQPDTGGPLRRLVRGLGEIAAFAGEAILAVLEFVLGLGPWRPRREPGPKKTAAPFPIDD